MMPVLEATERNTTSILGRFDAIACDAAHRLDPAVWRQADSVQETFDPLIGGYNKQHLAFLGDMNGRPVWINQRGFVYYNDTYCRLYVRLPVKALHPEHLARLYEMFTRLIPGIS